MQKYADFYEAGALLLDDNRPPEEQTRLNDYEICFMFHSETPIASTVPFTIMKMKYEPTFLSDDTYVDYYEQITGSKIQWKELKHDICYSDQKPVFTKDPKTGNLVTKHKKFGIADLGLKA